jgi:NAD+ kinase
MTLKIHFFAAETEEAQNALRDLTDRYGQSDAEAADMIVVLGGDGTMLDALHAYHELNKPFYGMNLGTVGFLLNPYEAQDLGARLAAAQSVILHPLRMIAKTIDDQEIDALAFNEVALLRERRQTARLSVHVDDVERLPELMCDGIMVASPAGSTAYNLSAHGPILPLSANVLALTPISAFRPRRWRGALLPGSAIIRFEVQDVDKRPVSATADSTEVRHVKSVSVHESRSIGVELLFNPDHDLEERVLKEQFVA